MKLRWEDDEFARDASGAWTIKKPTACGVEQAEEPGWPGSRHRSGDAARKAANGANAASSYPTRTS
jgi:hypothetical protein